MSAAAALATLDVIENEHLMERSKELGEIAREFFEGEQKRYDFIGGVRIVYTFAGLSRLSIISRRPRTALSGIPDAKDLPILIKSGCRPNR